MKTFLAKLFGVKPRVFVQKRAFAKGAEVDRLSQDWNPSTLTGDAALYGRIRVMRDRARQQELDKPYARRYYQILENNVPGSTGFTMTVQARDRAGELDKAANLAVWMEFKRWSKLGNCTVTGEDSWVDVQNLVTRALARDGGILLRKRSGKKFGPHGFQLQLLEIDQLDTNYNSNADNGNKVCFGIEKDEYGKTIAYHLLDRHPGEVAGYRFSSGQTRRRVDASEIIHIFTKERPTQSIGFPWLVASSTCLHHLGEYSYAELLAARAGAAKGGWFQSTTGQQFAGEQQIDADGNPATLIDFEPGSFDELPAGMTFQAYDPKHPTDAFSPFCRGQLLEASAGGGISYATLTGDLSEANYSSMRSGKLEEQEAFKKFQQHLIEHLCEPVFSAWLEMALLSGALPYTMADFDRLNQPLFRGRRWPWVDPSKDIKAVSDAMAIGITSRTKVVEEQGGDIEQIFEELADEDELAKKNGIEITAQKASTPIKTADGDEDPDETDEEEAEKMVKINR